MYELGEKAGWTLTLPQGAAGSAGQYTYTIRKDNFDVIQKGTLDLSSGRAAIEASVREPAMLYVEVAGGGTTIHLGAGIAPWKMRPSAPPPADFDEFWDGKLKALSQVPIDPVITPARTGKPGVELYTVKLQSLGSQVHGYLAKPSRPGKFPALVIYQWAGVYALQPEWVTGHAADGWLTLDVDSHDLPPSAATGVSSSYQAIGNTSRETSYFLNMYLRDVRAIDYIVSRPDWDGKTIAITGTSMGGQQSLAVAGLSKRVTAVLVCEPAGADSNGALHGRKAGYPFWPSDNLQAMRTGLYFDTVNFAPRIQAPVLAAMGFIDTVAPPTGIWIALNQVPGARESVPLVDADHNNITPDKIGLYTSRSAEVLNLILHGGTFKPAKAPGDR